MGKLRAEELLRYFTKDNNRETRVVRFHNVYGPPGNCHGGKEKSPAAISRKVALAVDGGEIEVCGDDDQARSYMYIDDCVEGLIRLLASDCGDVLNFGTDQLVTNNELVDLVCAIAGKRLRKRHGLTKLQGVRGRNSDNSKPRQVLAWEPSISLDQGLAVTYRWSERELFKKVPAYDAEAIKVGRCPAFTEGRYRMSSRIVDNDT